MAPASERIRDSCPDHLGSSTHVFSDAGVNALKIHATHRRGAAASVLLLPDLVAAEGHDEESLRMTVTSLRDSFSGSTYMASAQLDKASYNLSNAR
jgi:hypothetical protein